MDEFTRFISLIGKDKFTDLTSKRILIIGLGGVGGYALESLARCGIENFTIIDFDTVDITNINRQIIALKKNIGRLKTDLFCERLKEINDKINVKKYDIKVDSENIDMLFEDDPDYVIDAIDDVNAKKLIILECLKRKIKFISCLGTGNKFDPSKLEITELKKTSYDKLAKILRKWINENNIKEKIMVVSSKEQPKKITDNIIASTSFVPPVAGFLAASYVINDFLKD